ncbi:hypothetical protein FKP32DRAFT_1681080 [Trametes sanguinea]|nr:hypothetical protein FKP32DRAFT_1681080 [Trametes sanguinea]
MSNEYPPQAVQDTGTVTDGPSSPVAQLTIPDVEFTCVRSGEATSSWFTVTLVVFSDAFMRTPHWQIAVSGSELVGPMVIDMASPETDASKAVELRSTAADGVRVHHVLYFKDTAAFMALVGLCSSIRMYVFTGACPY